MVQKEDSLIARLSAFVRKSGLQIQAAYLFGSRARGDALKESDVDVILVSQDFADQDFFERMTHMYRFWDGPESIEPLYYTPDEFSKKKSQITIVREAMKDAVPIPL